MTEGRWTTWAEREPDRFGQPFDELAAEADELHADVADASAAPIEHPKAS